MLENAQQKNNLGAVCQNIDCGNHIVNAWTGLNTKITNAHCPV